MKKVIANKNIWHGIGSKNKNLIVKQAVEATLTKTKHLLINYFYKNN